MKSCTPGPCSGPRSPGRARASRASKVTPITLLTPVIARVYHCDISFSRTVRKEGDTPMTSIQTLYDALIAVGVVIGIAAALTLAIVAAGAQFRRDELHTVRAIPPA